MIIRVNRFSYQVIICVQLDRTEQQRANKELHSTLITLRAILCISTRKLKLFTLYSKLLPLYKRGNFLFLEHTHSKTGRFARIIGIIYKNISQNLII